jgi:hypothetical protein
MNDTQPESAALAGTSVSQSPGVGAPMFCHATVSEPPAATVVGLAVTLGGWMEMVLLTASRFHEF